MTWEWYFLFPSSPARAAQRGGLGGERRLQADGFSKRIWYPEQADRDRRRRGWRSIASQPVSPAESSVSTLCPGKRRRHADESGRAPRSGLEDFHALVTHQLHACSSMLPPTPIFPEQGGRTDPEWMQQHADLAWLRGFAALPLALLPERAGTTTVDAGSLHDAQAPVSFSAVFMRGEFLVCRAPQRSIWLERKV
jgi:hypothetical protein